LAQSDQYEFYEKERKMNSQSIFRILLAIVLLAVVAGLGVYAYNLGIDQGIAQSGKLPAPPAGVAAYPYYGRPFGFLGLFCLAPLLFFALFGILFRGLFWHGPWRSGGHYVYWENGVPPRFEEWHRKAHEPKAEEGS
jgi:hypothetical protein